MSLPTPLPPVGLQVLIRDHLGFDGIGWIIAAPSPLLPTHASIAVGSVDHMISSQYAYDDSATPANLTWRYDPAQPIDALPADLATRITTIEQAQAAGAPGYGLVAYHSTGSPISFALTGGTYETLTGGALQGDSAGITYDDSTGEILVDKAGVYLVSLAVSQRRLLGLTSTEATAAIFLDGIESQLRVSSSLAAIADTRTITAQAAIRIGAGAILTARTKTAAGTTIEVEDFLVSLTWLAA